MYIINTVVVDNFVDNCIVTKLGYFRTKNKNASGYYYHHPVYYSRNRCPSVSVCTQVSPRL